MFAAEQLGGAMAGFLGAKEILTRERVKEILQKKQYSYLEEKVSLLEVRADSLLVKISFLIEYHKKMISIEERDPIVIPFKDFKVEDWGEYARLPISNEWAAHSNTSNQLHDIIHSRRQLLVLKRLTEHKTGRKLAQSGPVC